LEAAHLSVILDDKRRQPMKRSKFSEEQIAYVLRQRRARTQRLRWL
jgi:hypothetical protein